MPTRIGADRRGAALVEFALVLPCLALLLLGLVAYGQYFLLAHSVQQIANDAARATVAGLTPGERETLARDSVARDLAGLPELAGGPVTTTVEEAAERVAVRVRYDASARGLFRATIVPMPDAVIERRAVVRPGGFR